MSRTVIPIDCELNVVEFDLSPVYYMRVHYKEVFLYFDSHLKGLVDIPKITPPLIAYQR